LTPGDIHWVELPAGEGHEQAGRRPAVIIQDDVYASPLPVVLVIPLTGALAATRFPGTLAIEPSPENGLRCTSVALAFQLRALDRQRLREKIGTLTADTLTELFTTLDKLMGRTSSLS